MPSRFRHRLVVGAAALATLGAVWAAAGYWGAPQLLRQMATGLVQDRMHRELALGDIHVDPFNLRVTIEGARLPDATGEPMLGWQRAQFRLRPLRSIWLRAPVLTDIRIEGLQLQATVDARGRLNLADLALLSGPADGKPAARWLIESLALESDQVRFSQLDRSPAYTLPLSRLALQLSDFGTAGTHRDALDLKVHTEDGGRLDLQGQLHLAPLRADARLSLTALPITVITQYLANDLSFETQGGHLSLDAQASVDSSGPSPVFSARLAQLTVADASLTAHGSKTQILRINSIAAQDGRIDSQKREASLGRLAIDGLDARIWRNPDGSLNLAALAGATRPSHPDSANAGRDWRWRAPEVIVTKSGLSLEDRTVQPAARLVVRDLALRVGGLSQDLSKPLDIELSTGIGSTGQVTAKGIAQVGSRGFKGHIEARDIDLRPLQPYINQQADLSLLSGQVDATLDVNAAQAGLQLQGEAVARNFRAVDTDLRQDFLQWKRLHATGLQFASTPRPRLHIRQLDADAPYARVIVGNDRRLNLSRILRAPPPRPLEESDLESATTAAANPAPQSANSAAPQSALDVAIDLVRVRGASANFSDLWIQPNFAVGILDLEGTVQGLSSQEGSRAKVDLKGAVDRYAPAVIRGEINPLSASLYSDIAMSFRNMDLTTVTPYSGRFAGYEIKKGKLSLDFDYHIQSRRIDARHHVVLDQLELGEQVESPDATSLPIRLAVALLKDRHGVIDVQLPVSGSLDDPRFRVAPLVWRMLRNLVVKAATSPFALLGSLFGGGDEVNQVVFTPGTVDLDDASRQRLESLRKAMVERPGLRLDVPAAWSADVDRPAMLRRQLDAQLAVIAATAGPDRYQQLVAAWREEAGAQPQPEGGAAELEKALLERYAVDDQELEDLGRRRALAVQDLLFATKEVDPVRVFVVDGKPAAVDAQQLRIDLRLK